MTINTLICLPLHAGNAKILKVLAKYVGHPHVPSVFDNVKHIPIDSTKPPSDANPWHHDFERHRPELSLHASLTDMEMGAIRFSDAAGNAYGWNLHLECEKEDSKLLMPGCTAFAVAVGIQLVNFFGGSVTYSDLHEQVDYRVRNKACLFPKRLSTQHGNDRWYQFEEALMNVKLISIHDLETSREKSGRGKWTDKESTLLQYLEVFETQQTLNERLPTSLSTKPKTRM